jgi:hypothetical protein
MLAGQLPEALRHLEVIWQSGRGISSGPQGQNKSAQGIALGDKSPPTS